jgi:hypothetical protein
MYTYLRNIGHLSSLTFLLESLSLYNKLQRLFLLLLTQIISCDLDLWKGHDIRILTNLYLKSHQLCLIFSIFLERESWSYTYYVFVGLPPKLDHAHKCSIQVFFGGKRFGYLQRCFHGEFLELQKLFWLRFKVNLF